MNTINTLKQELIDHLHSIDKGKLSMYDLKTYTDMVKTASEMDQGNYLDTLMKAFSGNGCTAPAMPTVPLKGGEKDG